MSRICRSFAAVAAGLMLSAAPALAQDRGREPERKPQPASPADALKQLQAELERMKAMEAELQAKMQQLKGAAAKAAAQGGNPFGGDRGLGGAGGFGGGNRGFGGGGFGPGGGLPIDRMSPDQIKELIGQLQKALEEKTRGDKVGEKAGTKPRGKPVEKPGVKPGKLAGEKPGAVSQDEILKRLDRLTAEVEELKRALKK
jgi:hypothetical protein